MEFAYELDCLIDDEGKRRPFSIKISTPFRPVESEEEYHCLVYAPYLFEPSKRIAGIDEEQALELSKRVIGILIEGKKLYDENGESIRI